MLRTTRVGQSASVIRRRVPGQISVDGQKRLWEVKNRILGGLSATLTQSGYFRVARDPPKIGDKL
jgi:hypothetical protein